MLRLMELDLLALKGSVVSSSRFWSVYGFSMPLGSGSAFAVGASVSAAASKWRSQHTCSAASPLLGPGIIGRGFCSPDPPCAAGRNLLGRCCVDPSASLRLAWASLSPRSSRSGWQGCEHLTRFPRSALRAHLFHSPAGLCIAGTVRACFCSPGPPSAPRGLCARVSSLRLHSITGYLFFFPLGWVFSVFK